MITVDRFFDSVSIIGMNGGRVSAEIDSWASVNSRGWDVNVLAFVNNFIFLIYA